MNMDLNKLMQQAQQMQEDMQKAQEEMAKETVEGSAGGGAVTVRATGTGKLRRSRISCSRRSTRRCRRPRSSQSRR